jgi:ribosomal protein L40E
VSRTATEQEVQQAQELLLQARKEFGNDPLVAELEKELAGKATALAKRPMPIPAAEMSTFSRICLYCGAPNPPENSHCLKCDQLFQESINASSELPDKPLPQPPLLRTVNKEKTKLLSILGKSLLLKSKAMVDSQQHLLTAIVAVGLLLFIGWWLIKPSVDPASKKILGTAIASVNTELREGARIIGKLPKGTPLEILHKPGFSNQLVQDPDFFLLVRTKPGDGKPVLSGSVQVRDLENLEIESNKAFTGWHLLWLAMNRFPNAELTDLKDLRQYLEFVNKEIETHSEAAPPFALLKHQAVGYLSLARRSKTPDATKMGCKGAERYIGKLPASENQVLTAEYKASCASQPAPAPKPSCTEILKEVREKLIVAGDLYSNDHFGEANKIFQQILKADSCNSEVRAIRQQASEYHTKCLAKLKSSESS